MPVYHISMRVDGCCCDSDARAHVSTWQLPKPAIARTTSLHLPSFPLCVLPTSSHHPPLIITPSLPISSNPISFLRHPRTAPRPSPCRCKCSSWRRGLAHSLPASARHTEGPPPPRQHAPTLARPSPASLPTISNHHRNPSLHPHHLLRPPLHPPNNPTSPPITLLESPSTNSTAHCLHLLPPFSTVIALPCDYHTANLTACIQTALMQHERHRATATVVLHPRHVEPDARGKTGYVVDHYALLSSAHHLLALLHPSDITAAQLRVPSALLAHHSTVAVRSDLYDPHIYLLSADVLSIMHVYKGIASLRYDLVPFPLRGGRGGCRSAILSGRFLCARMLRRAMRRGACRR